MTVVRYACLRHSPIGRSPDELAELEVLLSNDPGAPSERRQHRRLDVCLEAVLRDGTGQAPAEVVDIGGGGLRVRNDFGLAKDLGDRLTVSLFPDRTSLRVDIPVAVVAQVKSDLLGLRFCGPPLRLNHRRPAPARGPARRGIATMTAATIGRLDDVAA